MNEVYGAENVQGFDTASASLKDCTNAGDLSAELKIAGADRCNAYTLSHSLQNVDKGVTEELYKSLVMAAEKGIITPETRWNEGITKAEAIEIIVNAFNQCYDDNGYLVNNGSKGSTQVLEAQAEELWNKQDANDMNCTKEQFIDDYIKEISGGMTPEEFEESIEGSYSIKFAEKEKEDYLNQIWEENKDNLTCDKDTFIKEYEDFTKDLKPEEISKREFIDHVTDKYGTPEETTPAKENNSNNNENSGNTNNGDSGSSSNGGNSNGGSSNNGGGNNDTPVYNPPTDNGSNGNTDSGNGGGFSNNDTGSNGNSGGDNGEGFVDIPDGFEWDDDFADYMKGAIVD